METWDLVARWIAIGVIILFAMMFTAGCVDTGGSIVVTEPLISLDRNTATGGHFFLGSGTIEGKPTYSYYVQTINGGLKLKSVSADICTIYRDQDSNPYISAGYAPHYGGSALNHDEGDIGDRFIVRKYGDHITHSEYKLNSEVEIHIPRNSTIGGYNP